MPGGEHAAPDFVPVGPFCCCRGCTGATRKAWSGGRSSGRATSRCRSASRPRASAAHGRAVTAASCCPTCCSAARCPTAGRGAARGSTARRCAGSARTSTTRCGPGPSGGAAGHHAARGSASCPFTAPLGTAAEWSAPTIRTSLRAAWARRTRWSSRHAADRAASNGEPQRCLATWPIGSEHAGTTRNSAWTAATRRSPPSRPHPSAGCHVARAAQSSAGPRAGYVAGQSTGRDARAVRGSIHLANAASASPCAARW
jgi:hypothetical protein